MMALLTKAAAAAAAALALLLPGAVLPRLMLLTSLAALALCSAMMLPQTWGFLASQLLHENLSC
jgi:hypothetical protein